MNSSDLVVIGAGPGGYVAAIRAAQLGLQVTLVEKHARLGGTCLNVGCIPTKALLESSELYARARHGLAPHGIGVEGVSLDLAAMMRRKAALVEELTGGIRLLMKKHKITVVQGTARLTAPNRVSIRGAEAGDGDRELEAKAVLLATGGRPVELPGLQVDGDRLVTSTAALSFDRVPTHLVVVGAGAIGLELGCVWQRLGARVTVVELEPQVVPHADSQVAKMLQRALKKQGLELRLSSRIESVERTAEGVRVAATDDRGQIELLEADRVLVAVGRRANTEGLGLQEVGVALDERGRVKVDDQLATSVPGVYAIGDLIGGPMLAHKASEEGVAVAERLAGQARRLNYDHVPSVVYTWPELAQVGLTEAEAEARGLDVRAARCYFKASGRAKTMAMEEGLVKIVAEAGTDRLLGVHIVGPNASELIGEATVALHLGARAGELADAVHAHPTLSETIKEAALALDRRAIHG